MLMSSVEPKTVYINAVETPCVVNYLSGPFGGLLLTDLDSIPEDSVVKVQKKTTQDILNNVRKIKSCVYSCDITWGIFEPVGSPLHAQSAVARTL